ncbi:MAG: phytoene/squalene synthase family protein [Alphaproteobacteria bacterium]|nr:phytoene/squalene synthase family protein [Alphaproteobacteria bacterium]
MSELVATSTDVLARHGRSFSLASWFLPEAARADAAVLYAFCRLADDLVDEAPDPSTAHADVAVLRAELRGDTPARPLVAEVQRILEPVGLTPAFDLLDGVESDLGFVQPADDEALFHYCYQVAGTVGLMMCPVIGVQDRQAWDHAVDLGVGMQLTNICRDVLEDAGRERVYLPRSRFDVAPAEVAGQRDRVATVVADLLDIADARYTSGRRGFPNIPLRTRVAIAIAARLYQGIGHRLRRQGCDALAGRTVVPGWEKGVLAFRGALDAV